MLPQGGQGVSAAAYRIPFTPAWFRSQCLSPYSRRIRPATASFASTVFSHNLGILLHQHPWFERLHHGPREEGHQLTGLDEGVDVLSVLDALFYDVPDRYPWLMFMDDDQPMYKHDDA